jgi:hypothetical protein
MKAVYLTSNEIMDIFLLENGDEVYYPLSMEMTTEKVEDYFKTHESPSSLEDALDKINEALATNNTLAFNLLLSTLSMDCLSYAHFCFEADEHIEMASTIDTAMINRN